MLHVGRSTMEQEKGWPTMASTNPRYLRPGFRRADSDRMIERSLSAPTVTVYKYHCPWRNTDRTLHYVGDCVVCGLRTWEAEDGENDPRGIMGDHATHALVAADYDMVGPDVPLCAIHGNEYDAYHYALDVVARARWSHPEED